MDRSSDLSPDAPYDYIHTKITHEEEHAHLTIKWHFTPTTSVLYIFLFVYLYNINV